MSWLQQLVGKLKSLFVRSSAQEEAGTNTLATARTETPAAERAQPAATAVVTEEKPAEAATATTEEPVEAPAAETEAQGAGSAVEEPAVAEPAEAEDDEPAVAEEPASEPVAEEAAPEPVAAAETPDAAPEPVAEEPAREATDPAISTLDVESINAELKAEGPYGPGSGKPAAGGAAPSEDFTVKGKESSKLFHTEKSPYFSRTKADVWFKSEADAESAGFQAWDHKKRAATKK